MSWEIKIRKAVNGFVVEHESEGEIEGKVETVIEEDENDEFGELETMKNLLYFIKEHFGCYYSKHNKKNVNIEIEEQDNE